MDGDISSEQTTWLRDAHSTQCIQISSRVTHSSNCLHLHCFIAFFAEMTMDDKIDTTLMQLEESSSAKHEDWKQP